LTVRGVSLSHLLMLHLRRGIIRISFLSLVTCGVFFLGRLAFATDLTISITIPGTSTPELGGGGGGTVIAPRANVSLSGLAYPSANMTFLKDGAVIGTDTAAVSGTFWREFIVGSGQASFGVWARDRFGLLSPTISVSFEVVDGSQANVESIALPPTIAHEKIGSDGSLVIYGSAFPRSTVRIFNNNAPFAPPFETIAGTDGVWRYRVSREAFNPRSFSYKASYQYEPLGILSPFSLNLELRLETCVSSDFNGDGVINLTDLSILLFYWGRPLPKTGLANGCVDRNQDQVIDLQDFSILMYEWTVKYELSD
jgi:hypothetical protein